MLYGFNEVPPLDVLVTWSEKHDAIIESGDHKVKLLSAAFVSKLKICLELQTSNYLLSYTLLMVYL